MHILYTGGEYYLQDFLVIMHVYKTKRKKKSNPASVKHLISVCFTLTFSRYYMTPKVEGFPYYNKKIKFTQIWTVVPPCLVAVYQLTIYS